VGRIVLTSWPLFPTAGLHRYTSPLNPVQIKYAVLLYYARCLPLSSSILGCTSLFAVLLDRLNFGSNTNNTAIMLNQRTLFVSGVGVEPTRLLFINERHCLFIAILGIYEMLYRLPFSPPRQIR